MVVRSAIWDAAMDLFADQGFDETTIEEIAARAGISRRSFFRYFASKSELMASSIGEYAAFLADAIRVCPAAAPVSEVVRRAVLQVAEQCTEIARTRKVMQVVTQYPAAREALHSRDGELRECVAAAFLSRGKPFRDLPPGVLTGLTLAVLDVVFYYWFRQGEDDIRVSAAQVLEVLGQMSCPARKAPGGLAL